jgi:hypothetical protein
MITNRPGEPGRFVLADQIRKQSHVARTLDGVGQLALMPGADAGALAGHDLAEGRQVTLKRVGVLIIDLVNVLLAEPAGPVHRFLVLHGHNRGSRVPERMIRVNQTNGIGDGFMNNFLKWNVFDFDFLLSTHRFVDRGRGRRG